MKYLNKILIAGAIICAFCLGTLATLFIKNIVTGQKNESRLEKNNVAVKTENNTSESIEKEHKSKSYLLRLEDSTIYAYVRLPEGEDVLWNSIPAPPTLSDKDRETLERGITTQSFEELCLYFESYSS